MIQIKNELTQKEFTFLSSIRHSDMNTIAVLKFADLMNKNICDVFASLRTKGIVSFKHHHERTLGDAKKRTAIEVSLTDKGKTIIEVINEARKLAS